MREDCRTALVLISMNIAAGCALLYGLWRLLAKLADLAGGALQ